MTVTDTAEYCHDTKMKSLGFSLIELVLTVSIIIVLISITYPNYRHHIQQSYCQAAKLDLLVFATDLALYHAKHHTFSHAPLRWHYHHHYHFQLIAANQQHYRVTALSPNQTPSCQLLTIAE